MLRSGLRIEVGRSLVLDSLILVSGLPLLESRLLFRFNVFSSRLGSDKLTLAIRLKISRPNSRHCSLSIVLV